MSQIKTIAEADLPLLALQVKQANTQLFFTVANYLIDYPKRACLQSRLSHAFSKA